MPSSVRDESALTLKFSGGLNTRASEADIDERECASGENFTLRLGNSEFSPRRPFELVGTVPNASEIRGFASLLLADGTVSMLVQAGDTVYEWDGGSTFTSVGTVDSAARLRGRLEHNWAAERVLITDLELAEEVHEWDGTTFQAVPFTDEADASFGTFRAKYCYVSKERAVFANVHDNGTNTPHMMVGAEQGDYTVISVSNRPSSSLSASDPFFLLQPDLHPINGVVEAFGQVVTSSEKGSLFRLAGDSAEDFAFEGLFPRSGASGDEALVFAGNDIHYGRPGRIESVAATDRYGDVASNDLSLPVADDVENVTGWTLVHNARVDRTYCFPEGGSEVWVLHKPLLDTGLSPWARWTTEHASALMPTAAMNCLDPADGLEYVFFGDASGNLYRLEGKSAGQDGGTADIRSHRLSRLYSIPLNGEGFRYQGYIRHRLGEAFSVTLTFEYSGESIFTEDITINVPAAQGNSYYGGGHYYRDDEYYGTLFEGRLTRKKFGIAGQSGDFQVRVAVIGATTFDISEIGLRFDAAS